jgi:nucleotide-binding universal stress UspA family protein
MLKNLLLGLDTSEASKQAEAIALKLAARFQSRVTALSVIDEPFLTLLGPAGTGTTYHRFVKDVARLKRARVRSKALLSTFHAKCQKRKVALQMLDYHGDPYPQVLNFADRHDLIVIGRDTTFHTDTSQFLGKPAASLVKDNPRPVILCCPGAGDASSALIAYDGSIPAMRAVQMFLLLQGLAMERVHVVTIDGKKDTAEAQARRAAEYLNSHGLLAESRGVASKLDPADALLEQARKLRASLLVMGAYGRTGWRETLFGSCTRTLLRRSVVPLFVYH